MKSLMKIINLFGLKKKNETDMHSKERVRKKKNELCMERKMKNKTEKYENDRREGNKENKREKQKCRLEIEETKSKILKKMQFL